MRSWKDCNEKKGNFHPYMYLCFTQKCTVKHVIYIFLITWIIYCEVQRLKKRFQFIFSSMLEGKCPLKFAHHENGMCSKISWKFKKWKLCSCIYGLRLSRRGQVPFWPSCKFRWVPRGVADNTTHPDKAPHRLWAKRMQVYSNNKVLHLHSTLWSPSHYNLLN